MNKTDIEKAQEMLLDAENTEMVATNYDPSLDAQQALSGFLRHRLIKLKKDADKEERVWETLISRLPEAEISQVISLFGMLQKNNASNIEAILTPIIQKTQSSSDSKKASLEDTVNTAGKDVMDSLVDLASLLKEIRAEKSKKISVAESIKEALQKEEVNK
jgi:hypothetical protein